MPFQGSPAPISTQQKIVQQKRKTGLLRMIVGSTHMLPIEGGAQQCTAMSHLDVPASAKTFFFCQHEACKGREWPSFEAMRAAHPSSETMAKNDQVHVYGMWSGDIADPKALAEAKAAHEKAKKEMDEVSKMKIQTLADREQVKEYKKALDAAEAEVEKANACIGLIAPPDHGGGEG